jgi:photosystem II stability/assembly factor-like uncharacterized protein
VLASNGPELFAATDAGLAKSRDHGTTWTLLDAQPGKVTVISLAVSAGDSQALYVGTPIGLMTSTDGGASWTTLAEPNVPVLAIAVAPTDPARILILNDTGAVYRSDDGGASWQSPQ